MTTTDHFATTTMQKINTKSNVDDALSTCTCKTTAGLFASEIVVGRAGSGKVPATVATRGRFAFKLPI